MKTNRLNFDVEVPEVQKLFRLTLTTNELHALLHERPIAGECLDRGPEALRRALEGADTDFACVESSVACLLLIPDEVQKSLVDKLNHGRAWLVAMKRE